MRLLARCRRYLSWLWTNRFRTVGYSDSLLGTQDGLCVALFTANCSKRHPRFAKDLMRDLVLMAKCCTGSGLSIFFLQETPRCQTESFPTHTLFSGRSSDCSLLIPNAWTHLISDLLYGPYLCIVKLANLIFMSTHFLDWGRRGAG